MTTHLPHAPHRPGNDTPDEFEPGSLPVEPDQGPLPANLPEDPEPERQAHPGRRPQHAASAARLPPQRRWPRLAMNAPPLA